MEQYPSGGKAAFLRECQFAANRFADVLDLLATIQRVFNDRLYGPGLAKEISEAECQAAGFSQNDLYLFIAFTGELMNFMAGQPIFAINHNPEISNIRTDI